MTYAQNLWIYFALLFGIIIIPGMDMFFVMANSLLGGRARGMAATSGIMAGGVFHTVFGASFAGVISQLSPLLLNGILMACAAYMAWIGFTLVQSAITVTEIGSNSSKTQWLAFRQGMITCVLNPKAYVFTLAVYPQFIQPRFGPVWSQAVVMGMLTALTQLSIYGGLGFAAAKSRALLIASPNVTIWIGKTSGVAFILVAALTLARALTA